MLPRFGRLHGQVGVRVLVEEQMSTASMSLFAKISSAEAQT
ncbi:MAG: hypothetical protein U0R19_21830 [Bryobacteraceae bacterium]